MSKLSISEEQKSINQVLDESKERLEDVSSKLDLLEKEHKSILEDIQILKARKQYTSEVLKKKQQALKQVESFVSEAEESYEKLVTTTHTLLSAFKNEEKKIDNVIRSSQIID